jgi:hypothetical protein
MAGGDQQLDLAPEVVVDRRRRHVGAVGDVGHRCAVEAALDAGVRRRGQETFACGDAGVVDLRRAPEPGDVGGGHADEINDCSLMPQTG